MCKKSIPNTTILKESLTGWFFSKTVYLWVPYVFLRNHIKKKKTIV